MDIDQDGDRDLYAIRFNRRNMWFMNEESELRSFLIFAREDMRERLVSIADFDHDGFLDLFSVYRYSSPNELLLRPTVAGFNSKPQVQSVLSAGKETFSSSAFDYNGDGSPDIYVAHFGYEDALHLNDGRGLFTAVGDSMGLTDRDFSVASIPADFDSDGDYDLYVIHANERPNAMWRNENAPSFIRRCRC